MTPTEKAQLDSGKLVGELDVLLDEQFLNASLLGSFSPDSSSMHTALAIMAAKGVGPNTREVNLVRVCHDELVRHICAGETLHSAIKAARRNDPSKSAFNEFLDLTLTRLLAGTGPKA